MTPKLFKPENNTKAEEFKQFLPVNVTCSFRSLAPAITQCENKYLLPVLGNALFDRLSAYYQGDTHDNPLLDNLLELCQYAVVRLAYWQDYDLLSVSMSDKGAADNAGEGRLYKYQSDALKSSLKNGGFDQLDTVLELCESHLEQLQEFRQSPAYTDSHSLLVGTTGEFDEIFNIGRSRLVFLKMRHFVRSTQETELRHRLGAAFCSELLAADPGDERLSRILPDVKKFTVLWAVADGIGELHRMPTERGLVFETSQAASGSDTAVSVIPPQELKQMADEYRRKAERYMSAVIATLKAHISDYPSYRAFAGENAPKNEVFHRDNTNRKIFFALWKL